MNILETARLFLRRFNIDDVEAMCRILCDPDVMRFSKGVKQPAEVPAWIAERIKGYKDSGFGCWALTYKETGTIIAYCGPTRKRYIGGRQENEIGFRLARDYWSYGYATEIAAALRDYAFGTMKISRFVALVDPENTASIRVIKKIGMRLEKEVMMPGYDHPDLLYAIGR